MAIRLPKSVERALLVRKPRKRRASPPVPPAVAALCKAHGIPEPVPEFYFDAVREWRFDWFWLWEGGIAVEVEGGIWTRGRHTRGSGFLNDAAKYNEAAIRGIRVLRVTPQQWSSGEALGLVKRAMEGR